MADQKIKDDELTKPDLLSFGILPPEPDNPKLVKKPRAGTPGQSAAASNREDKDHGARDAA
jgi:hypothetical protein